jgi:BASS family bile acid:Na+ symporter
LKYITLVLLAGVYSVVIFQKDGNGGMNFTQYLNIIPFVFSLNVIGMFLGYFLARLSGFNTAKQITLAVEIGIQNSALAITLASSPAFLGSHQMAIPAVVYGGFTFFNAVIFGLIIRKWLRN